MAKRRRSQVHDGTPAGTAEINSVFIDTNLGTHIAVSVCSSDTVSDLKKKVTVAHMQSFPEIGDIEVHSVKLEQRSNYYHLSDNMLVWTAFGEVNRNWFLSVTASIVPTHHSVRSSMNDINDDCNGFISDRNKNAIVLFALPACAAQNNAVSETTGSHRRIYAEEHCMRTESPVKKKRKVRHTKDESHNSGFEGGDIMSCRNDKDMKPNMSDSIVKVSGLKNDEYDDDGRLLYDRTYLPNIAEKGNFGSILDYQNLNGTVRPKEDNRFESVVNGLENEVVSVFVQGSSAGMRDAACEGGDVNTLGKKKKRKFEKTAENNHDRTYMEQFGKGERTEPSTLKMEEGMGLSLENGHEVLMPSNSKASDHVIPDFSPKEDILLQSAEKSTIIDQNSHKRLDSDEKKEDNVLESKIDYEGKGVPSVHSGGVRTNISDPYATIMDAGVGTGEVKSDGKKRKKKKVHKTAEFQHTSDVAHAEIGEMNKPLTATTRLEEKGASLELDNEVIMPADSKAPDHVGPDLALKEAIIVRDADAVMEPEISSRVKKMKKKKRAKNSVSTNMENSDIKDIHNGTRCSLDLSSPAGDHVTKGIGKDESTMLNDGMDVEMRPLDAIVQHTIDVAHTEIGEVKKPHTETTRLEEKGASLELDNESIMAADSKAPDHVGPDLALKETSIVGNADAVMEAEISSCVKKMKKRRKTKNSVSTIENSGITDIHNGPRSSLDLSSPSGDHITAGTGKDESTRLNEGVDVEMTLLDASNKDAQEKVWDVNRKEEERTVEDLSDRNKMMMEKTKSFPDVYHAALHTAETENTILKPNQANQDGEITENKSRKTTKKGRKQKHTATDVQENLQVEDEQVGVEPLATKETSFGFANSELASRDVESSQVLSRKSEEKVDENYELVLNTDGLKENTEKGSEGINFKQYFVADQLQNQVDISNKVRKANKLKSSKAKENELMKTSSPSELCEMPRQKPNDFVAPSSSHKKNPSLDKSSSKRSVTLHNNKGNERMLLRSHVKKTMPMKTPKKKILLAKSGTIFHNDSGESYGDENGTLFSDDRTLTSSDSSSMSGDDSEGESEVSQISTRKGSSAAKGKTLDMLEEENVTMDVILRSSKRFKKAKEIATQIEESQPIDFVPDSQPV
ncbi:hypothetical protein SASPL_156040 [Salvia splendens]|uniref:Uncharacterized protein n=1 Tax=Salvia splendens TaxID=180675 RepID=A0A8X8VXD8_SALSN|nr:uncharacterized protein LOC121789474 [Salvia splendens]KAG6384160.1 hypothetical protein SASPL_156040 [Salvia splendens]